MRIECKKCKRNLTGMGIKLLEGKINKIVCKCEYETMKKYHKEFDLFLDRLVKINGVNNY